MLHLDLFSGIGGFAYAADTVWGGANITHIFCDNDPFCRQVLNKHWKDSVIYNDIRQINTDTIGEGLERGRKIKGKGQRGQPSGTRKDETLRPFILTGGFPCQPFSAAGLRRGTSDDRFLWPEMLRVIQFTKPTWVIAENVRGLLTLNEGVVFQQVCADLEANGYEVQPFIIPAVSVNAPHRRDRIWFVAHAISSPDRGTSRSDGSQKEEERLSERDEVGKSGKPSEVRDASNPRHQRQAFKEQQAAGNEQYSWDCDWLEVATELCGVDDGLSAALDGFELSKPKHRQERLKSLGNSIVPQVAIEIMKSIKHAEVTE